MSEEIDPELDKLLNDIENAEESSIDDSIEEEQDDINEENDVDLEQDESEKENIEELDQLLAEREDEDDDGEEEYDDLVESVEVSATTVNERERLEKDIMGLVNHHVKSASSMFDEAETDRKKIDDIIAIILPRIEEGEYKSSDILALTNLIQTKTDVSRNRASLMDSIAKLFASIKNNDSIGVNGGNEEDLSQEDINNLLG